MALENDLLVHFRVPEGEIYRVPNNPAEYVYAYGVQVTKCTLTLRLLKDISRKYSVLLYGAVNPHDGRIWVYLQSYDSVAQFERILRDTP